jgi:hypothetical protein
MCLRVGYHFRLCVEAPFAAALRQQKYVKLANTRRAPDEQKAAMLAQERNVFRACNQRAEVEITRIGQTSEWSHGRMVDHRVDRRRIA